MDTTAQSSNDQQQGTQGQGVSQTPQNIQQGTVVTQLQSPVGSSAKEVLPVASGEPASSSEQFIQPTETSPSIPKEVAEAGVEAVVNQEAPRLTLEDQKAGVVPAKESVPVPREPSGIVQLSTTMQATKQALKKQKNPKNSIMWLLTLWLRHLRMLRKKEG